MAVLLLACCAAAQDRAPDPPVLKDVLVSENGGHPQVELVLTSPVEPTTTAATHPDRLIIDLPNTIDASNLPKMQIKSGGLRTIEILHSLDPEATKIVIEVDRALEYEVSTVDNHLNFNFLPASGDTGGALVAAKRGALTGLFHREKSAAPVAVESAKQVPSAAAAGALAGRQLSQPPLSGSVQKAPEMHSKANGSGETSSAKDSNAQTASLGFPSVMVQNKPPGSTIAPTSVSEGHLAQPQSAEKEKAASSSASVTPAVTTASTQPSAAEVNITPEKPQQQASGVAIPTAPVVAATVATPAVSAPPTTSAPPTAAIPEAPENAPAPAPVVAKNSPVESVPVTPPASAQAEPAPQQPPDSSKEQPQVAESNQSQADSANVGSATALMAANTSEPRLAIRAADPNLRTVFRVKYVADGVAYLDGGRNSGLKEGVKLEIRDADGTAKDGTSVAPTDPRVVAELEVSAVAESSSVSDIHDPKRAVKVGDLAYLSSSDADALVQQTALSPTRKYPAVISFTAGDPGDDDMRAEVPRPPLPSVNRARGRFGFDYMGTVSHGAASGSSSSLGMMFRGDITRIGGTYWNLSGFWRGRLTSQSSSGQQTLQDLINRTYHLSMTYSNPNSNWVAGFGRLYLPWANSLETIDGGYVGRKVSDSATVGIFGGSTPDPTSYNYAPNRSIGGAFVNFSGGDFQKFHYSSTMGAGVSMLQWKIDRPFAFFENSLSFSQRVSVYDALQVDSPAGNPVVAAPGPGLSRNFFTVRFQVSKRLELDGNHTYFRDIPTFDPTLISTGLLDKYLFQGFSAGARFEFMKNATVYTQLGRSSRTGDAAASLNQLYGITFTHLPLWALRADFHYAEFNSSFGSGKYKAFSVGRSLTDALEAEVLVGQQSFKGVMTTPGNTWFVMNNLDMNFGAHYFVQGSFTTNRGQMSYDQWMFTVGYRFDSKGHHQ